jgi:hypothetical protein
MICRRQELNLHGPLSPLGPEHKQPFWRNSFSGDVMHYLDYN